MEVIKFLNPMQTRDLSFSRWFANIFSYSTYMYHWIQWHQQRTIFNDSFFMNIERKLQFNAHLYFNLNHSCELISSYNISPFPLHKT